MALAVVGLALLGTAGCADLQQPEVQQVALAFTRPGADPADRCALLAPATITSLEHDESQPCPAALGQLPDQLPLSAGPVQSAAVWGDNAQVRLPGDTLFLTLTDQGWKVTAAGCTAQEEGPYQCRLEA
jgi:hypothetical protein